MACASLFLSRQPFTCDVATKDRRKSESDFSDVIIIGAGVVGLSIARELASNYGISVKVAVHMIETYR